MKAFLAKTALALKKPLANMVLQLVLQAESAVPGKDGAAKKAYVVKRLDDMVTLPWFLEPFDGAVFEVLTDVACRVLNSGFGHDWTKVKTDDLKFVAAKLAKALKKP